MDRMFTLINTPPNQPQRPNLRAEIWTSSAEPPRMQPADERAGVPRLTTPLTAMDELSFIPMPHNAVNEYASRPSEHRNLNVEVAAFPQRLYKELVYKRAVHYAGAEDAGIIDSVISRSWALEPQNVKAGFLNLSERDVQGHMHAHVLHLESARQSARQGKAPDTSSPEFRREVIMDDGEKTEDDDDDENMVPYSPPVTPSTSAARRGTRGVMLATPTISNGGESMDIDDSPTPAPTLRKSARLAMMGTFRPPPAASNSAASNPPLTPKSSPSTGGAKGVTKRRARTTSSPLNQSVSASELPHAEKFGDAREAIKAVKRTMAMAIHPKKVAGAGTGGHVSMGSVLSTSFAAINNAPQPLSFSTPANSQRPHTPEHRDFVWGIAPGQSSGAQASTTPRGPHAPGSYTDEEVQFGNFLMDLSKGKESG